MRKKKIVLSLLSQKAVELLKSNYVYVSVISANLMSNGKLYPQHPFSIDRGIYSTQTGMRVRGFGNTTFHNLRRAELLDLPISIPSLVDKRGFDRVYTLRK